MALNAQSRIYLHLLQNTTLIVLALIFTPLCTLIAIASSLFSPYTVAGKQIEDRRKWKQSSPTFRPRIVLVSGVGMAKGLAIARAFHREGHTVIGADFEPNQIPVSGRFSRSLHKFYQLPKSSPSDASSYIDGLINIIKNEHVELWVSCSGVASAVEDGHAADAIRKLTPCKTIQFGASLTETLHGKHSFIESCRKMGLNAPTTQLITSVEDAVLFLHQQPDTEAKKQFIVKSVGLDDAVRADMTLLPRGSVEETRKHISRLSPSAFNSFVLQQFISGPEYCTHSIVIRGKVRAFTSCESAGILMHYKALPIDSELAQAMLKYTQIYAANTGRDMTGHFSMDFLVESDGRGRKLDLIERIYPIECNPRAHTAVLLFENDSKGMVEAYLSLLDSCGEGMEMSICTPTSTNGYFWVGHDLVEHIISPFWNFVNLRCTSPSMINQWMIFVKHILSGKEGTFVVWDPWPAWWLYCVYWPLTFTVTISKRSWWSKCNVSTNKLFRC